jgi:hypothetical protein
MFNKPGWRWCNPCSKQDTVHLQHFAPPPKLGGWTVQGSPSKRARRRARSERQPDAEAVVPPSAATAAQKQQQALKLLRELEAGDILAAFERHVAEAKRAAVEAKPPADQLRILQRERDGKLKAVETKRDEAQRLRRELGQAEADLTSLQAELEQANAKLKGFTEQLAEQAGAPRPPALVVPLPDELECVPEWKAKHQQLQAHVQAALLEMEAAAAEARRLRQVSAITAGAGTAEQPDFDMEEEPGAGSKRARIDFETAAHASGWRLPTDPGKREAFLQATSDIFQKFGIQHG